jgi:VCBS repeat-containing protein
MYDGTSLKAVGVISTSIAGIDFAAQLTGADISEILYWELLGTSHRVLDGYLSSATVFADANGNGKLDPGEVSTTTDANGNFTLSGGSGPLVAFGGTDISTGLSFQGQLSAPAGSSAITPLTTLLTTVGDQSKIAAALNLPSGIDLTTFDPIAATKAGDPNGAAVYTAGAKVYDTVAMIASALAGAGENFSTAAHDAFAGIAAAIVGSGINFDDKASVSALISNVAQTEHITLGSGVADNIATVIAASNTVLDQKLAADGAGSALLSDVAAIELVAQGTESAAIQSATANPSQLNTLVDNFTGSNLNNLVNGLPVANPDSGGIQKGSTLTVNTATGVLANAIDPNINDHLTVTSVNGTAGDVGQSLQGQYGSLTLNADGSYTYVAKNGSLPSQIVPQDVFTYSVSDGHGGASVSTLTITVLSPSQSYQAGANTTLNGGNGKSVLDGTGGHDILLGGNGPDVLIGGPGDKLTGGNGPDVFVFGQHFGLNTITDFDVKNDAIQVSKGVFATVTDLLNHTADSAAGAVITASATDQITLVGVTKAQLMAHQVDFYFA